MYDFDHLPRTDMHECQKIEKNRQFWGKKHVFEAFKIIWETKFFHMIRTLAQGVFSDKSLC